MALMSFLLLISRCQWQIIELLRLLRSEANHTALNAVFLTFSRNSSSRKRKITGFRPGERVFDSFKALKHDPHQWRHYEVTTGEEIFGQEFLVFQFRSQPFQECMVYECCAIFPPYAVRQESAIISLFCDFT